MRHGMWVLGACLFVGLLVLASTNGSQADVASSLYGFSVAVQPDNEFAGFVSCGMSIFTLADEKSLGETPALLITSGGANSMKFIGIDGVEVTFSCGVNAEMTEATYEIAGRMEDRLVLNHLATVRLK